MTNINYPDNIAALYARLSQEDALDGESNSIAKKKQSSIANCYAALQI